MRLISLLLLAAASGHGHDYTSACTRLVRRTFQNTEIFTGLKSLIAWIAMRHGDLKDLRAIDSLTELLSSAQWPIAESSKAALIRIGGDNVAAAMR